ncbi:hypothetical protein ACE4RR_20760 [Alteribacillus sp. HJP-4]
MEQSSMGLTDIQTPDNTIQYEIQATPEERKEIEALIEDIQQEDATSKKIINRALDERNADQAKNHQQEKLDKLYRKIHELGPDKTKEAILSIRDDLF